MHNSTVIYLLVSNSSFMLQENAEQLTELKHKT